MIKEFVNRKNLVTLVHLLIVSKVQSVWNRAERFIFNLPIAAKQIDSINTFKSHLKAFLFSRAYDQLGLTVQEDYAL